MDKIIEQLSGILVSRFMTGFVDHEIRCDLGDWFLYYKLAVRNLTNIEYNVNPAHTFRVPQLSRHTLLQNSIISLTKILLQCLEISQPHYSRAAAMP